MSGIANKVRDTFSGNDAEKTRFTDTTTAGSHSAPRTMASHNVDPTTNTTTLGDSYTMSSGPAPNTDGPHKSDLLNKADPRVDSDRDYSKNMGMNPHGTADTDRDAYDSVRGTGTATGGRGLVGSQTGKTIGPDDGPVFTGSNKTSTGSGLREGAVGPHSSRIANAADPRVDSDLDNSRTVGAGAGRTTAATGGLTGTHHTSNTHTSGLSEGTAGPHSSRIANAADPRVDSDLDNSRTVGSTRTTGATTGGLAGSHPTAGTHHHTSTTGTSGLPEGTAGPHSSRIANAADPRVDSDLDNTRTAGATHTTGTHHHTSTTGHHPSGTTGHHSTGTTGHHSTGTTGHHSTGTTGHHSTGTTGHHSTTTGHTATLDAGVPSTGPAPNTAGPHKSDLLNKLDPRVDSDLDGSKTVGGNKTFASSNVDSTHTTTTR